MENLHSMYLREPGTKRPVGIVVTRRDQDNVVAYQYSVWNPVQEYDRSLGYKVALGRFETSVYAVKLPQEKVTGHLINTTVLKDMLQNDQLPTRARVAIKAWLKKHGQL
jgi:hypothetical protein